MAQFGLRAAMLYELLQFICYDHYKVNRANELEMLTLQLVISNAMQLINNMDGMYSQQ